MAEQGHGSGDGAKHGWSSQEWESDQAATPDNSGAGGWSGDEVVKDQDEHVASEPRGWSGDQVEKDHADHSDDADRGSRGWSGDEYVEDKR